MSVGFAVSRTGHPMSDRLLDRADRAMYRAKRGGGDTHRSNDPARSP